MINYNQFTLIHNHNRTTNGKKAPQKKKKKKKKKRKGSLKEGAKIRKLKVVGVKM